ncbi:MAG: hypothetical protein KBF75_07090 [Saprospiraceae bacterium]|jgi:hypothetical protein|nr:hypothetical protein [Saprospiraceae bacterium]MCA0332384.1 hypothetical protein [Bacteroidota bacterium]MCB0605340.1 hypothetical protein [Saprospiraceae bacterium]
MELLGVGSRISHPSYGDGVVIKLNPENYEICFMTYGIKQISKDFDRFSIIEKVEPSEEVSFSEAEKSLIRILKQWSDVSEIVPLGDKWKGGIMELRPSNISLKSKEIPIETFFHKIVMLRDRVRVMEQRINSHPLMNDEDKVNMQQYITRIYGSLTSFNVLFKNADQQFVGEKS